MSSLLKKVLLCLYPRPWKIGALPSNSLILFPRKIEGGKFIVVGADTIISPHAWLAAFEKYKSQRFSPKISIGAHVRIGSHVILTATDSVELGDGCLLSQSVFISDHTHEALPGEVSPSDQPLFSKGPVRIGKNCFIGIRAVIMPGVILGDCCVVGANSVVTKSFPAGSVVAGAPARLIRRNTVHIKDFNEK